MELILWAEKMKIPNQWACGDLFCYLSFFRGRGGGDGGSGVWVATKWDCVFL